MIIHPTRTNLLMLKDKRKSVLNSIGILKARKQALIKEFLSATAPFLRSREDIRKSYGRAIKELHISMGREGPASIGSVSVSASRDFGIEVAEQSIWGLKYKNITYHDTPVRKADERGYDEFGATVHLEDSIMLFEKLLESMLQIAEYESKLKRLGEEIVRTTRRIKVLEEMVLPGIKQQIRSISQYIGEREREAFYRLKRVKGILERKAEEQKAQRTQEHQGLPERRELQPA
jgi:V/A-type H+-transporting ATPase subunit D